MARINLTHFCLYMAEEFISGIIRANTIQSKLWVVFAMEADRTDFR